MNKLRWAVPTSDLFLVKVGSTLLWLMFLTIRIGSLWPTLSRAQSARPVALQMPPSAGPVQLLVVVGENLHHQVVAQAAASAPTLRLTLPGPGPHFIKAVTQDENGCIVYAGEVRSTFLPPFNGPFVVPMTKLAVPLCR